MTFTFEKKFEVLFTSACNLQDERTCPSSPWHWKSFSFHFPNLDSRIPNSFEHSLCYFWRLMNDLFYGKEWLAIFHHSYCLCVRRCSSSRCSCYFFGWFRFSFLQCWWAISSLLLTTPALPSGENWLGRFFFLFTLCIQHGSLLAPLL